MEPQKPQITKAVLSKNKAGDVTILDFKIYYKIKVIQNCKVDFPSAPAVKKPLHNAGDVGSVLSPGRSHLLRGNQASSHNC